MANERILIVEDEQDLANLLRYNLEKESYRAGVALDGEAGLAAARKEKPDLIILDVMLPRLDGFEFLKIIRREQDVPILILTAKKEEFDKVLGLELGADDYMTKPFSVREILARVKAILKRTAKKAHSRGPVRIGELAIDLERYEVRLGGDEIPLSSKEFSFLRCLVEADGRALSRDILLEKVWGYDKSMEIDTRTVDQHISRLREKLGSEAKRLVTVKNVGYRLKTD